MNLKIGTVINQRYEICEALGEGGQGSVFRVEDTLEKGSSKALKILSSSNSDSMFRLEFEQAKQLVHPNLARVFDLGRVTRLDYPDLQREECNETPALGALFFTQEFVNGTPAHLWMKTETARKDVAAHAARIGLAAAQCLSFIHHSGLLHRDVKPSNILVEEVGRTFKLIDFGLAASKNRWDGFRAGTLGYAAEEVLYGYPDERSDLYSLGVTLAELVSGQPPRAFFPPYPEGFLKSIFPRSEGESALLVVIERMTAPKIEHRYQTASDAAEALAELTGIFTNQQFYVDELKAQAVRRIQTLRARAPRLAGRTAELDKLVCLFEGAGSGEVKTAIIRGAPGVGKSRLFQTAAASFQLQAAKTGIEPPEFHAGKLRGLLDMIVPKDHRNALLASWIDGTLHPDETSEGANEDTLVAQMADVLLGVSRPAAYLIEADDLRLVSLLLASLAGRRTTHGTALVVAAEIQEFPTGEKVDYKRSVGDAEILHLPLYPLEVDEEADLAAQIVGKPLPGEIVRKIHEQTGGIPLVTEALLAALLPSLAGREIGVSDIDAWGIESNPLDAAVKNILRRLDSTTRNVVETAAVIGESLSAEDLHWVLFGESDPDTNRTQLASCIAALSRSGWMSADNDLIAVRPAVADRIVAMLKPARASFLHRRALSLFDRNQSGRPPWQIADHAYLCADFDRAREASLSAYRVLSATGDLRGAASYLKRALDLHVFPKEDEGRMSVRLAKLYRRTGNYSGALETAEAAEAMGGNTANRATLERASALRLLGRSEEAAARAASLTSVDDPSISVQALAQAARIHYDKGDLEAAAHLTSEIVLPDDLPSDEKLEVIGTVGLVALHGKESQKAVELLSRGLLEAKASNDLRSLARFHGLLGMLRHRSEDYPGAQVHYTEAARFADKCGDRHGAATYRVNLAAVNTELSHFQEALDAYLEGLSTLRRFGRLRERAQAGANYAELLLRLKDSIGAEAASRIAVEDMRKAASTAVASVLCVRGDILLSLSRFDEAEELLREAEAVAEAQQSTKELAAARLHLAASAIERNNLADAEQKLSEAKAADCDAFPTSAIEARRLALKLAEAEGKDSAPALVELMSILPFENDGLREEHLKALAFAATVAHRLGRRDIAERAARAAIRIAKDAHEKTPPLYQTSEPAFVKEMNMILGVQNEFSPRERSFGWEHLVRINTRLNSEFRVRRLLEMIMDAALDIARAERGFLLIAKPDGELKVRCARNMDKESLSLDESSFSRSAAKKAFESKEPLLTADAGEDTRFHEMKSVVNLKLRYIVAVPLLVDGKAKGAVYLDSRQAGRFDESTLTLLEALADQAAIALTNARLKTEIEQRQIRIEKLNRELAALLEQREVELREVKGELEKKNAALIHNYRYEEIIARSKPMSDVFRLLDRVTAADFPVILQGESGTGKELAARAIHFNGARKKKPFVAENCAAIPETLMESVLFGHVKGAFTGATTDNRGLFVEADGGTLFLDEVSELSLPMQAKLLRVLQNNEVRPLGGAKTRTVDVRVLAATNQDLKHRVKEGAFREDLYYRLNVIEITLPPLRERKEDILLLAEHFISKHSHTKKRIHKAAAEILLDYSWPGNVRRLENEMVRAAILSDDEITPEHLSPELVTRKGRTPDDESDLDLTSRVDRLKKRLLSTALTECKGNQTAAADRLGISRFGLQKMMKRLGV